MRERGRVVTIVTWSSFGGETRRCDGKCHAAKRPMCECICGGRYHGCGSSKVAQEKLTEDWGKGRWAGDYKVKLLDVPALL